MNNDDLVRLRHMLDAACEAVTFAHDEDREALDEDRKLVLALVKDIEIIGEAAYQVSQTTRDQLPNILWNDIIGMRHRLVHAYFDINLGILWHTVQDDLPALIGDLEQIIEEQKPSHENE